MTDWQKKMRDDGYDFTRGWFDMTARALWDVLMPQVNPRTYLEVGAFEGSSSVYMLQNCPGIEIHAVDPFEGGDEPGTTPADMIGVEERFERNTKLAMSRNPGSMCIKHKARSDVFLAQQRFEWAEKFSAIYIDGSHMAADALTDSILAFPLLQPGGVIIWDDYNWGPDRPAYKRCKPAIDAWLACFETKYDPVFIGPQVAVKKR